MKILMASCYFPVPMDDVPIGGVQRHIARVTAALKGMGHQVMWGYKQEPMTTGPILLAQVAWCDWIIAHDWYAYLHGMKKPQGIVFHGWEGKWPPVPAIVAERKRIARLAKFVVHIGTGIAEHYGTVADATMWGGVRETKYEGPPKPDTFLWTGRLEPDTCPEMAIAVVRCFGQVLEMYGDGTRRSACGRAKIHGFIESCKFPLTEFTFCTGYLTIMEACMRGSIPVTFYGTPMRHDRLAGLPCRMVMADNMDDAVNEILGMPPEERETIRQINRAWALTQTWDRVAQIYVGLMGRKDKAPVPEPPPPPPPKLPDRMTVDPLLRPLPGGRDIFS